MAFATTHIAVSLAVINSGYPVTDISEFLLGSISPDSVHTSDSYNRIKKQQSHLYAGRENWGEITVGKQWYDNVIRFLLLNRRSANYGFILGYCTHIITDIMWNNSIVLPLKARLELEDKAKENFGHILYNDCEQNDFKLYEYYDLCNTVWPYLSSAKGIQIDDIVNLDEIRRYKEVILKRYEGICGYNEPVEYITLEENIGFINKHSMIILRTLHSIGKN